MPDIADVFSRIGALEDKQARTGEGRISRYRPETQAAIRALAAAEGITLEAARRRVMAGDRVPAPAVANATRSGPRVLSVHNAATVMGLPASTVESLIKQRRLRSTKVGGEVRVYRSDAEALGAELRREGLGPAGRSRA